MDDTKKLIEKYKRELMELSRTRQSQERQPQIIGYSDNNLADLNELNNFIESTESVATPSDTTLPEEEPTMPREQSEPQEKSEPQSPHEQAQDDIPKAAQREFPNTPPTTTNDIITIPPPSQPQLTPNEKDDAVQASPDSEEGGSLYTPVDYTQPNYTDYDDFLSQNSRRGTIMFRVSTAQDSLPIENAKCVITKTINGIIHEIDTLYTDESGKTEPRYLPAPPRELSQNPENKIQPFALYDATVTRNGFTDVVLTDIPVFDGTQSVQRVSMLPSISSNNVEIIDEVNANAE